MNGEGRYVTILNSKDADTASLPWLESVPAIVDLTLVLAVLRMSKDVQSAFRKLDIVNRCN